MARNEIILLTEHKIVKHNTLIQKSRYNLSEQEQKIILSLVSKIKPDDSDLILYDFTIKEFCEVCGIDETNGKNYALIKEIIFKLANKSIWVTLDNGDETIVRWIERPYINKRSGVVRIKLDDMMRPYLLQLRNHFTSYHLYYTLAMKSKYSIRIYELLKSYENLKECVFKVDDLKRMLFAEKYKMYKDFRVKVLDIAMREINDFGDINVSYRMEKEGKKADEITFAIATKKDTIERVETFKKIEQRISSRRRAGEPPNVFVSYNGEEAFVDMLINNTKK